MKVLFILVAALALVACEGEREPEQAQRYSPTPLSIQNSNRFNVVRVDVFRDKLAYDGKRGVYVITDKETNQEFIGVSGIGISELAQHSSGKTTSRDER